MKIQYRHGYVHHRPRITVCKVTTDDCLVGLGVSICSFKEMPNRKLGNAIALGRAIKALAYETNGELLYVRALASKYHKIFDRILCNLLTDDELAEFNKFAILLKYMFLSR